MKQVTMTRAMRPYGKGDTPVLSDDMADRLVKSGEAENPRPFPPSDVAPSVPVGSSVEPKSPARRGGYFTRKKG